jgi:hypothetical protein
MSTPTPTPTTESSGWTPAIPDTVRTVIWCLVLGVAVASPVALALGAPEDIISAVNNAAALLAGALGVAYNPTRLQVTRR